MAVDQISPANGDAASAPGAQEPTEKASVYAPLDASKLTIKLTDAPKPIPAPETLVFGQTTSDHMLCVAHDPVTGWGAPEIRPYGPLSLDPISSCFQYSTNVFEGMKAYRGPDGVPRLFRPAANMARLAGSAARVALPPFDGDELLALIRALVRVDARWVPAPRGYSLYIRPTLIGTRASLGVGASAHALLYVVLAPSGPYYRIGPQPVALLAVADSVRAWPGGTGAHKLGANYAPGFVPQRAAQARGYDQILWLFGPAHAVTEAGAMNFFVVLQREDGDLDVLTPPLDGTILPGITRASILALAGAHAARTALPHLARTTRLHPAERALTMRELAAWSAAGVLREAFVSGTAAIVAPVGRIGFAGADIVLPAHEGGLGPVARAMYERLLDIQEGREEWEGWSVRCE